MKVMKNSSEGPSARHIPSCVAVTATSRSLPRIRDARPHTWFGGATRPAGSDCRTATTASAPVPAKSGPNLHTERLPAPAVTRLSPNRAHQTWTYTGSTDPNGNGAKAITPQATSRENRDN